MIKKFFIVFLLIIVVMCICCVNVAAEDNRATISISPGTAPYLNCFCIGMTQMTKISMREIYDLGYTGQSILYEINGSSSGLYKVLDDVSGTFRYYELQNGNIYLPTDISYTSGGYTYSFEVYGALIAQRYSDENLLEDYLCISWCFVRDEETIIYNWNGNISPMSPQMNFYYDDNGIDFAGLNSLQKLIIENSIFYDHRLGENVLSDPYEEYLRGVDEGREQAYSNAWKRYREELAAMQEEYEEQAGVEYLRGKSDGYNEGTSDASEFTFSSLISSIFLIPGAWLTGLLNFEFLGVNLRSVFYFFLTLALIIAIIHFIRKKI